MVPDTRPVLFPKVISLLKQKLGCSTCVPDWKKFPVHKHLSVKDGVEYRFIPVESKTLGLTVDFCFPQRSSYLWHFMILNTANYKSWRVFFEIHRNSSHVYDSILSMSPLYELLNVSKHFLSCLWIGKAVESFYDLLYVYQCFSCLVTSPGICKLSAQLISLTVSRLVIYIVSSQDNLNIGVDAKYDKNVKVNGCWHDSLQAGGLKFKKFFVHWQNVLYAIFSHSWQKI